MALLLVILPFGCGKVDNPSDPRVFQLALTTPPATLDPAFARDQNMAWVAQQLFEGLIRLDSALRPTPALATRWTVSPDGLTYTFTLRRDAYFHPDACFGRLGARAATRRVSALDVVFSFSRVADPATASPGQWIFNQRLEGIDAFQQRQADRIAGLSAPNDSTLVIRLAQPFAPFLSLLAMPYAYVVPPEAMAHYGAAFGQHPVGSGPFALHYAGAEELILRRSSVYYDSLALAAVHIRVMRSRLTALRELLRGRVDLIDGLDPTIKDDVLTPEGQLQPHYHGQIELVSAPALTTEYLGFNLADTTSPWRDPRLRRAVSLAIDRAALVRYVRNGQGTSARGLVPPGLPGADAELQPASHDPAQARRLLAEAGFAGGIGLPPLSLLTSPSYRAQGELLQRQLAEIGLRLELDLVQGAAAREQIAQGRATAWRASWQADYPHPENFYALFGSAQVAPAGPNTTRYRNPTYDLALARLTQRPPQANDIVTLERILADDSPAIFLYHYRIVRLVHPRVRGLQHSPLELLLDLRPVRLSSTP